MHPSPRAPLIMRLALLAMHASHSAVNTQQRRCSPLRPPGMLPGSSRSLAHSVSVSRSIVTQAQTMHLSPRTVRGVARPYASRTTTAQQDAGGPCVSQYTTRGGASSIDVRLGQSHRAAPGDRMRRCRGALPARRSAHCRAWLLPTRLTSSLHPLGQYWRRRRHQLARQRGSTRRWRLLLSRRRRLLTLLLLLLLQCCSGRSGVVGRLL